MTKIIGSTVALIASLVSTSAVGATNEDFFSEPPILSESTEPLILLGLSVDHELFKKAYNDYSNLEGGILTEEDTTYRNDFDYYGYFDSSYCYTFNSGSNRFEPGIHSGDSHKCPAMGTANTANAWSGNFLNWATMTRMDIVRRVLYGGKRSTDSETETVLERAHLNRDVHAFVKVYSGSDVGSFTPYTYDLSICNVTSGNGTWAAPIIRIARGQWPQWSAGEREQCQWDNQSTSPAQSVYQLVQAMTVRVLACVNADEDSCAAYPGSDIDDASDDILKPVGLLQENGEDGERRFGLITGSYIKNHQGGILRKQISKIASNDDPSKDEINLSTGVINTGVQGIIYNLDLLKVAGNNFTSGNVYADCNSAGITVNTFLTSTASNRKCADWGNPLAEIYLEGLRYLAGNKNPTAAFDGSDSGYLPLSRISSWEDPYDIDEACSQCAFIMLSSGMNSFDGDDLSSAADLPGLSGASSIDIYTNSIGLQEFGGSFAGSYLSGGTDENCAPRVLTNLSDATGICPERPALRGTYDIAGLAYYAKTEDLRTQTGFDDSQQVDNYMVELAESLPSFTVNVAGSPIRFLPACQSNSNGNANASSSGWQGCSLVDVQIESMTEANGDVVAASYLVYWEDSHWGLDYDTDVVQRLQFCVGSACGGGVNSNEIKFTSTPVYAAAGFALRLSYTITGTASSDGIVSPWAMRPGNKNFDSLNAGQSRPSGVTSESHTFTPGTSVASLLPRPLYLAAKYGGFNDINNNGEPDSRLEWDIKDSQGNAVKGADGNYIGDGVPDNYYQLSNPALLKTALNAILTSIKSSTTSSAAAAVVSNSASGDGAIFQGTYYPVFEASSTGQIKWAGQLHGIFYDSNNYFREDNPNAGTQGKLDGYDVDYRAVFEYDTASKQTRVHRYSSSDDGETWSEEPTIDHNEFGFIWNARNELGKLTNAQVKVQRASYGSNASTGRYILSGVDVDNDGMVGNSEQLDFDADTFDPSKNDLFRYFGLDSTNKESVTDIINFIRGEEGIATYRTRAVDYDDDGAEEVWRLGDVVNSAPTSVSVPRAGYDSLYGDDSYTAFRQHYEKRRQVIYVGGNDGMLHAFNAGFYDSSTKSYRLQSEGGSEVAHPLGAELWAYVPMSVLPHLQWLTSPDYKHTYYVDGSPRVYEVNIFDHDEDHINGWGTILVVGMRFGGGDYSLDPNSDEGEIDLDGDNVTMRSSYLILDVTNPEKPPQLLAEVRRPPAELANILMNSGGSGYISPPLVTVSGAGSGLTAEAVLAERGELVDLVINNGGSGYSVGDSLSVEGDGSGAVVVVTSVDGNGAVTGASVSANGTGYSTISVTASRGYTDAVLETSITDGKLVSVGVTSGGSGYSVGDAIAFVGNGTGAVATVGSVDGSGAITSVNVAVSGSDYTAISVDSVVRSGAETADITGVLGFAVESIGVASQGENYNGSASVTVAPPGGTGATATASVHFGFPTWGYTTSRAVVVKRREDSDSSSSSSGGGNNTVDKNDWYLIFGSGPSGSDALSNAESNDSAKLFYFDLKSKSFVGFQEFDSNAFVGNLIAEDWDGDYTDDAVYFGTVATSSGVQDGELKRLKLTFGAIEQSVLDTLLDTNNPVYETPRLRIDGSGNRWIYSGSGRFIVEEDNSTTELQHYYGIIEPQPFSTVSTNDMVNTTDIQVFSVNPNTYSTDNYIRDCESPCADGGADVYVDGNKLESWQELRDAISQKSGWYRELTLTGNTNSGSRTLGSTNFQGSSVIFSEYSPSTQQCEKIGLSRITGVHYLTGTASPYAAIGTNTDSTYNDGALVETDFGTTNSLTMLPVGKEDNSDAVDGAVTPNDDKGVPSNLQINSEPSPFGRQSWREIRIDWDAGL